jgi:hypothetical protein
MGPSVDVNEITKRAQRHWMEDGLVEMMLGLLMFTHMGVYMTLSALPEGPRANVGLTFLVQALVLGITLAIVGGFKRLKARVSFPRTGYVAFPKPTWKLRISIWAIFATVFAVAEGISMLRPTDKERLSSMAAPAFAIFFAACLIGGGLKHKQLSMLWEGLLTMLFAVYLTWFTSLRGIEGLGTLMILVGLSMALLGGFRFRRYLKAHPRPEETEA